MTSDTNGSPALDSLLMRRAALSEKKRMLLDALLNDRGIEPQRHRQRQQQSTEQQRRSDRTGDARAYRCDDAGSARGESSADCAFARHESAFPFYELWKNFFQLPLPDPLGWGEWIKHYPVAGEPCSGAGAHRAAAGHAGAPASALLTIRASGEKIPVFFVHALLGSAFHYHHLAALLEKDQPVYALQAPGLDGIDKPLENVADFAALYIDLIRSVQPRGPYKLGGYSLGGWIAFEMAQRLVRSGEEVGLLLILGTDVPVAVSMPLVYEQIAFFQQYQEDFEKTIIHPFLPYEQRIRLNAGENRAGTPLARLVRAHNKAVLRYDPQPYPGKITLLETIEQQVRTPYDRSRGWKRLSLQEVETHLVAGNHLSMLNEPHVRDLAQKITLCLDKT